MMRWINMSKYSIDDIHNLIVMCGGSESGDGKQIYNKCCKAFNENRTNIRITYSQTFYLFYELTHPTVIQFLVYK